MTDSSGLLRDWRVVLCGATAVLCAAVVTLVVRTGNPATADSVLTHVRDAAVVLPDGHLLTAHDGQVVPDGATVRTGAVGGAQLVTSGRDVFLGALSTVRVVDGIHQRLERGQVMVDGRGGPRLDLDTRAGTAAIPAGGLVRVETGPVLRLGVFRGSSSLTAAGRQARTQVPELYQLQAPYLGLPGTPTPLALTDDAWEQQLDAGLVSADRDLNALEHALSGNDGLTVLQAAPVALRQVTPISRDRGEQALGVAVSQASRRSAPVQDTLAFVQTARDQGGSWGVVAALVDARVSAVSALLDSVLAPPPTPPGLQAGPTPAPLPGQPPGQPTPQPTPGPTATQTPAPHASSPHPGRTPKGSPSSSTTPDSLLTTVMHLLSPSPSPARQGATPVPTGLLHLPLVG